MSPTKGKGTTPLAIDGGSKAFTGMTGKPRPKIGVEEFFSIAERFGFTPDAMKRLRKSLTDRDLEGGGPHLGRYYGHPTPAKGEVFEDLARKIFQVPYAQSVSSGTGALHSAMVAVGAGPGKEVICAAVGFVATSLAVALVGAKPVFCDVDESLQLDPSKLESLITKRTVAIAVTHFAGVVCDVGRVMKIARRHKLKVIEDCAQAPGATYKGKYVGTVGDIGCFSISSYKIIGGGEGGMFITHDERLFDRMRQVSEAGGLWRPNRFAAERYKGELFIGTNYRLSELESAVNVIQMRKLKGIVGRFRAASRRVRSRVGDFKEMRWQKSNDPKGDIGYSLRLFPATGELGQRIVKALKAEGISAGFRGPGVGPDWHVYCDMLPLFGNYRAQCRPTRCPVAADLYDRNISISVNQWWSASDCDAVARGIRKVLSAYCTPVKG